MTVRSQEGAKLNRINLSLVIFIKRPEAGAHRIIILNMQVSLQHLKLSLKIDLFFQNSNCAQFDVSRQIFVSPDSPSWPIQGNISEKIILTGKQNLAELLIREFAVTIIIKELNK